MAAARPPGFRGAFPIADFTRRDAFSLLGLCVLVCVSYYPSLAGGFVWDDLVFSGEPVIHAASGLWNIWFSPGDIRHEGHYWPIVYTTFYLEHKLWGFDGCTSDLLRMIGDSGMGDMSVSSSGDADWDKEVRHAQCQGHPSARTAARRTARRTGDHR